MYTQPIPKELYPPIKVLHSDPSAKTVLLKSIYNLLNNSLVHHSIVVLCIGTDRSTGDSLGPLVGSRLKATITHPACYVYGTLENPVHAVNLLDTLHEIGLAHQNPFIIAVDACLGQTSSVGFISVAQGPLKPGAGVNKELPEVGDLHVTGIVNVGGFMEYLVLQNTRLSIVMQMAEKIAYSIASAIEAYLESDRLEAKLAH